MIDEMEEFIVAIASATESVQRLKSAMDRVERRSVWRFTVRNTRSGKEYLRLEVW